MSSSPSALGRGAHPSPNVPRIEFRNISKRFGSIQALSDVSFAGHAGSVHAITGENGAGKSTLMKLLAGIFSPDSGEIRFEGRATAFESASQARDAGVSTVFQELTLLPNLTIAENLFLGREPRRFGFIDRTEMRRRTREALARIGIEFDADASCGELVIAEQHLIEIAKGAAASSGVIIYDEPTAALDARGVDKLVRLIDAQKKEGKLIFYISHRLDEIFRLCDTTTVLKDGRHVTTCPTADITRERLVSLMVGRELSQFFPQRRSGQARPKVALRVSDYVTGAARRAVSFDLNRHEIVGLTGLEGQGQREVIRALAGLVPAAGGVATKYDREGRAQRVHPSVVAAVRAGLGFVPEDRKSEGLYLPLTIEQNIGIGMLRTASMISNARVDRRQVRRLMRAMQVRARDESQTVSSLSGGNQQKVMIGRWLASGIDVLLIEEPTRGVDVGAKSEIYKLLREFSDGGGAVLITSSELTEHLGLCDRILVMREHEIVAEVSSAREASEEAIMRYALFGRAPVEEVA
jgi:ribose transport system ATP-binding protein